jgi:ATP-dependent DNA helicase RecQ
MNKHTVLKEYFGYDTFRPLQEEIIDTVISGKDALVLMPTGGGKSLCFQVPALMLHGICIVISPLIALMKDQVQALQANGIAANFINSSLSSSQQTQIESACLNGTIKLLYVSPEKIFTGFMSFLKQLNVSLFAIDEAHCVSFWGHDFRPEYAKLNVLKKEFPKVPVLALTATADKVTRKDILNQLAISEAEIFISSFDRPNLSLNVVPGQGKTKYILQFLKNNSDKPGIIYCLSRKNTEELSEKLKLAGFNADYYHAGMDANSRSRVQDAFLKDDITIICATIAFGMGINKSNIRWVLHYNLPGNVESFYQEIGRAGRDGMKAETILFYSYSDVFMRLDLMKELTGERKELQEAKLERMKQYAEADICRRRILLSYFNETADKDCGNCDVCLNPRSKFDATVIAQKALSAIVRTQEKVAMGALIDILRGSQNKNIIEKGYNQLKTFGAGRDLKTEEWTDYLLQMLNSGVMDIAYDEAHTFKLNTVSWQVLKENKQVLLVKHVPLYIKNTIKQADIHQEKTPKNEDELLFEKLRKLRKKLADEQNVPAFVIFSDKTLEQMVSDKPQDATDMLNIQGVIQSKFDQYGEDFLRIIQKNKIEKDVLATGLSKDDVSTYTITLHLLKKGKSVEEISKERGLNPVTIYSHLCKLYEEGEKIDLKKYVLTEEIAEIHQAVVELGIKKGDALKPVFEHFNKKYEYYKIRIICSLMEKGDL